MSLARALWKSLPLPQGVRRAVSPAFWGTLDRVAERHFQRKPHAVTPGPVRVAGFFSESHGIAASAKRCADAMEALGVETQRVDLGALSHLALLQRPSHTYPPGGAWIIHANAPEFVVALATIGADAFAQSFLAGYWAWELPDAPPSWKRRMALADEIWTPSAYTARALGRACVVPHPAPETPAPNRAEARALLGLPADRFIAVTLFDFRSSFARKNPLGALNAFERAFADDDTALLIIKAQHGDVAPELSTALQTHARGNVRVIDEVWPGDRASALIAAADVLISLHRAEGFGLTLAEAMAAGTPVIATAWSGNVDFMAPDYGGLVPARETPVEDAQAIYAGQHWAAPDIERASALLQRVRSDAAWRRALEETGRRLVRERLGLEAYRKSLGPAFWAAVRR